MIFLIQYNRKRGSIVTMQTFDNYELRTAQDTQLKLELKLNLLNGDDEVVLLNAESEAALRRTHRRYFETLKELATLPA